MVWSFVLSDLLQCVFTYVNYLLKNLW